MLTVNSKYKTVKASMLAINVVKNALKAGRVVKIPVKLEAPEVRPVDLIISDAEPDSLEMERRVVINEFAAVMHQNLLGVSVIDMFQFMTAFNQLANCGIFITDQNREEKYFEVIDKAQSASMPDDLPENASYAEEQEYLQKKKDYAYAQNTLEILERYLTAYDKIKSLSGLDRRMRKAIDEVKAASTKEEISDIRDRYMQSVNYMYEPAG